MGTGHYVLLERIGIGGMAEVFRASARGAEGFERPIAIKRILPNLSEDPEFVRMFVDEAKIAVQLQHPNIVQIFDLGRNERTYFIVMEFVHGRDLRALLDVLTIAKKSMPLTVVLHVAMKICEALHHAHFATGRSGEFLAVVHRDVTPQNVLLSYDGEVKVTDFGLAKARGRLTETQAGIIKGKLAYMAPEAFMGIPVDHRSDIYSVGILLWEMLLGRRLFVGKNDIETAQKAQAACIPGLRSIDPNIPVEIERIVLRALAPGRDDRYRTAEELHDDLEAFAYEHQQFLTSSAFATWFRSWFPLEPAVRDEAPRDHGISTREISITGDVASRRPSEPHPMPTREPFESETYEEDDEHQETARRSLPEPSGETRPVMPGESGPLIKEVLCEGMLCEGENTSLSPLDWDDEEETIVGGYGRR